jgi:hypothetical protein
MEHLQVSEGEGKGKVKVEWVPVRVMEAKGESALVQWDDGALHRAYVPTEALDGERCPRGVLDEAPMAGAPWELLLDLSGITPEVLADRLRRAGIWCADDLRTKDRMMIRISSDLISSAVHRAAKTTREKQEGGIR